MGSRDVMDAPISVEDLHDLLDTRIATPKTSDGNGELVVVGSGIASIRQMSLEALQYIRRADIVFFCGTTAADEVFIIENARASFDLRKLYGPKKSRLDTYIQMAEVMVRTVREGKLVVGVLYGHPGVFANPAHRAIAVARAEGFPAKMLPGISAEDNLFADLGIDPSQPGCGSYEASALLYHNLELDVGIHNVLYQPGCIGKGTMEIDNENLHLLLDYLEARYGADHPVFIYRAGVFPGEQSTMPKHTIAETRDPKVSCLINPSTTLYLPPKRLPSFHELTGAVAYHNAADAQTDNTGGVVYVSGDSTDKTKHPIHLLPTSAFRWSHPELPIDPIYGEAEKKALATLDKEIAQVEAEAATAKAEQLHVDGMYNPITASPALKRAAVKLSMAHHMLPDDPKKRFAILGPLADELCESEKEAILSGQPFAIEWLMRARKSHAPGAKPFIGAGPAFILIVGTIVAQSEALRIG